MMYSKIKLVQCLGSGWTLWILDPEILRCSVSVYTVTHSKGLYHSFFMCHPDS